MIRWIRNWYRRRRAIRFGTVVELVHRPDSSFVGFFVVVGYDPDADEYRLCRAVPGFPRFVYFGPDQVRVVDVQVEMRCDCNQVATRQCEVTREQGSCSEPLCDTHVRVKRGMDICPECYAKSLPPPFIGAGDA